MFSQMGGQQVAVTSDGAISLDSMKKSGVRGNPDVSAIASLDGHKLCVLAWHYHDDDVAGPDAEVKLALGGIPFATGTAKLTRYAIDAQHSNAYEAWKKMGSPAKPTAEQYTQLVKAGQLAELGRPEKIKVETGKADLRLNLPRQAVVLLVVEWP